jgi:hypothetical protein
MESQDSYDLPKRGEDNRAEEIKTLARHYGEAAIEALAQVMQDPEQKGAARAMAAKTLLDRGFGAPERRVEQKVDVHVYDERQAHLTALQKLAAKQNVPVLIDRQNAEDQ